LSYPLLRAELTVRRRLLRRRLPMSEVDLVVCETSHDALVLLDLPATTFYHCPTPWADELFFEGRLTARQHRRMRAVESRLMEGVDHLAFHWHTYKTYAVREYALSGRNVLVADTGCTQVQRIAHFREPVRIVYLGSLSSRFIDLPLLSRLSKLMEIDVYGGPPPDPALGLRYRGWSPPEVLAEYQFGLITCVDDPLRREGFSAKHLEYFAYGLPVLAPVWREADSLAAGTIAYTEETFRAVVAAASRPGEWSRLHEAAAELARRYSWEHTLAPVLALLERRRPGTVTSARRG